MQDIAFRIGSCLVGCVADGPARDKRPPGYPLTDNQKQPANKKQSVSSPFGFPIRVLWHAAIGVNLHGLAQVSMHRPGSVEAAKWPSGPASRRVLTLPLPPPRGSTKAESLARMDRARLCAVPWGYTTILRGILLVVVAVWIVFQRCARGRILD